MVPIAVAPAICAPAVAFASVTVKVSFCSASRSPATFTVIVLTVSLGAKLSVPLGNTPPVKSA